ncbi:MAG: glycosyltransferase family 9 protein [Pseudomonadota bacterium]
MNQAQEQEQQGQDLSRERLWVRLPNWLGDVVMAAPLLRGLREQRPQTEITLLGKAAFEPLVTTLGVGDQYLPLPEKGRGYFKSFFALRAQSPDSYLLFTNSLRGDMEAFLTRCPHRFGMRRPGKPRPLLTDAYRLGKELDETQIHQTIVWSKMAVAYGMAETVDLSPFGADSNTAAGRIGLICGTENAPEKRWPVASWRELIDLLLQAYPAVQIALYGTPNDRLITDQVSEGHPADRVANLAGQTDLAQFCDALRSCDLVCCNDTGGMHLSNLLGTPVVGIFGPTNPVRTGPIFDSHQTIVQPLGCPATGGWDIDGVTVQQCFDAIREGMLRLHP